MGRMGWMFEKAAEARMLGGEGGQQRRIADELAGHDPGLLDQFGQDPRLCQTREHLVTGPVDRAKDAAGTEKDVSRRVPERAGDATLIQRRRAGIIHGNRDPSLLLAKRPSHVQGLALLALAAQDPCDFFVRSGGLFHLPQGGLAVLPGLVRFFLKLQVVGKLVVGIDGLLDIFPDPAVFTERVVQLPMASYDAPRLSCVSGSLESIAMAALYCRIASR